MAGFKTSEKTRAFVAAFAVAAAFIALTAAVLGSDRALRNERLEATYQSRVVAYSSRLRGFIDTRTNVARSMALQMERRGAETLAEFTALTAPYRLIFPEIQAINWVSPARVIRWVTPLTGNERARDLDLKTLDAPARTLEKAETSGESAATPTLRLAQGGMGFVVYHKIPGSNPPGGYINVVFRLERLLSGVVTELGDADYAISVLDEAATLYRDPRMDARSIEIAESGLEVADRLWTVRLHRLDGTGSDELSETYNAYLFIGLFGSLLLGYMMFFLMKRRGELAYSERRFRRYANLSSDWFWETDRDLRFSFLSDTFLSVTGVDPKRLLGKTRAEVGAPGASPDALRALLEKMDAHRPFYGFVHHRDHPSKGRVFLSISGEPVFEEGRFVGYQGIGKDITQEFTREHDLRKAKEEAEGASKAKSEFLAHMSHELRTPLNAILGFSQMISKEVFGPVKNSKYLEYSHDIELSGHHLLSIVNDVLDLSKVEAGQIRAEIGPVRVTPLVEESVKISESLAKLDEPRIAIRPFDQDLEILGDAKLARQVLLNILANALKFSPDQESVVISVSDTGRSEVAIAVTDHGAGIPEEDIELVLEPFGQARHNVAISHEGTGLGLPLSVQLMRAQNGRLEIESAVGDGTTVLLTFPKAPTPAEALGERRGG